MQDSNKTYNVEHTLCGNLLKLASSLRALRFCASSPTKGSRFRDRLTSVINYAKSQFGVLLFHQERIRIWKCMERYGIGRGEGCSNNGRGSICMQNPLFDDSGCMCALKAR